MLSVRSVGVGEQKYPDMLDDADYVFSPACQSDPSGTEFGESVCYFFLLLIPRVAADGAPIPGDTDTET